jgi:hypothetical protein
LYTTYYVSVCVYMTTHCNYLVFSVALVI